MAEHRGSGPRGRGSPWRYKAENARIDLLLQLSRTSEAVTGLRHLLDEATESGDEILIQACRINLARGFLEADDPQAARTLADSVHRDLRSTTDGTLASVRSQGVSILRESLIRLGQLEAAHDLVTEQADGAATPSPTEAANLASLKAQLAADPKLDAATRTLRGDEARALLAGVLATSDAGEANDAPSPSEGPAVDADLALNCAVTFGLLGDHPTALRLAKQALATFAAQANDSTRLSARRAANTLASLCIRTGDLDGAQAYGKRVLDSYGPAERPPAITLQGYASVLFSKGRHTEARQFMWDACVSAQRRLSLLGSGLALAEQRHSRHAVRTYLSTLLSCRVDGESDKSREDTRDLQAVVSFRGAIDRQARALAHMRRLAATDEVLATHLVEYRDLCARADILALRYDTPKADVDAARHERDRRERTLLAHLPPASTDNDVGKRLALLPAGTVAVVTCRYTRYQATRPGEPTPPGEAQFCAFLADADQRVRRVDLGPATAIESAVRAWRIAVRNLPGAGNLRGIDVEATTHKAGPALPSLLRPLLQQIPSDATRLLICPDAALASIPWEALPLGEGRLLLDRVGVAYADNLSPAEDVEAPLPANSLFVAGGIAYGDGSWPALPGTRQEVEAVATLFGEVHRDARVVRVGGAGATRVAVVQGLGAHRFVHIATHGFARAEGLETVAGLLLSNGNRDPEAGVLRSGEIAGLDLRGCELVVLSACDSGQGDRDAAEAVAGHNRALLLAGARYTITSLWPIPDRSAAQFFAAFYRRLWHRGESVPTAFAETRRELRKQGLAAAVWAGFLLYGRS